MAGGRCNYIESKDLKIHRIYEIHKKEKYDNSMKNISSPVSISTLKTLRD